MSRQTEPYILRIQDRVKGKQWLIQQEKSRLLHIGIYGNARKLVIINASIIPKLIPLAAFSLAKE